MRIAFAIHTFLLAYVGGVAWHAGGSPCLLTSSMVVLLMYGLPGVRPGKPACKFRLVACAAVLSLSLLCHVNDSGLLWLFMLAMPLLLSATQCIREIRTEGSVKDEAFIRRGQTIFTLGFYATLGLAFLMQRSDFLNMERYTGMMMSIAVSLPGLMAWELTRAARHGKAKAANAPSGRALLSRAVLSVSGLMVFSFVLIVIIPLLSDKLCSLSPKLDSSVEPTEPDLPQLPGSFPAVTDEKSSDGGSPTEAGAQMASQMGQPRLPTRGTIDLSDEVHMLLKFGNSSQEESLIRQGPLYVRTFATTTFNDGQWISEGSSGKWVKDATDGKVDGRVEVGKPMSGEIAHEVFIPQGSGRSLPALAGVTAYGLPAVFARSDSWFQIMATGDIRYKAWSRPVNLLELAGSNLEAGDPGEAYVARLSSPFGARLTEIAGSIKAGRGDLSGRLESLRLYFQKEFKYSLTIENRSGMPPLENFLFAEKKGYCDFFAGSATLILRHMGIPSRVAYGYKDGDRDAATNTWIFREHHAHAWTEVFVQGQGWVICDFTPFSDNPSPRSVAPVPFDLATFKDLGSTDALPPWLPWAETQSLQALREFLGPAIAGLGLLAVMVGFFLRERRAPMRLSKQKVVRLRAESDLQPKYFLEFLRMCEVFGHRRLEGQTLMEFQRNLKQSGFCDDDFDDLAAYYYRSRYEDAPRDRSDEHRFLKRIREYRKHGAARPATNKGIHP